MFTDHDRFLLHEIHRILIEMNATTNTIATEIAALQAAVAQEQTIDQSAITLINSIPTLISNAVAQALAAGATADQLTALSNLAAEITTNAAGLASAVTANTPAVTTTTAATAATPAKA